DRQPRPATAEAVRCRGIELLDELVEASELLVDRTCELSRWLTTAARFQDRPEETVVAVSAAVVADRRADVFGHLGEVPHQLVDFHLGELGMLFESRVRFVDVRLMMLRVMDLHRLCIDMRLERIVSIWQLR